MPRRSVTDLLLLRTTLPYSNKNEWDKLAKWVVKNELFSDNVRWLIQIPRLYDVFKKSGGVESFEEVVSSALRFYRISRCRGD